MPLKYGNESVKDVYFGGEKIKEIYVGSELVFVDSSPYFTLTTKEDTNLKYKINGVDKYIQVSANQTYKVKPGVTLSTLKNMFANGMELIALDLSHLDTSKVTSMYAMFSNCGNLASINLGGLDTAKVTDMSSMFNLCSSIVSLDLSSFDTSKVTNMSYMFAEAQSSRLAYLDLSGFVTTAVTNKYAMFTGCDVLAHIKCKQAFKDWCWENQDDIVLPTAMRSGGSGTWELVD